MEGSAYIWGFLVPAVILLFAGFYLACQGCGAVKIAAALQIDSRAKTKLVKKRGLQIGLFFKVSTDANVHEYGPRCCLEGGGMNFSSSLGALCTHTNAAIITSGAEPTC